MTQNAFVHPTAELWSVSCIGARCRVWHYSQIYENSTLGDDCVVGRGVCIGNKAKIGNRVKIGNYSNIFGAEIEDQAFIGPTVSVLEDIHPRSCNPDGSLKGKGDFVVKPVLIRRGASIGAGSVILPGVTIGEWAMIAAGSVVATDILAFGLAGGNPARMIGYVDETGQRVQS